MTKHVPISGLRPRAVVLCAGMNGLGAVRSLGAVGVPVLAVALSTEEPVLRSRFGEKLVIQDQAEVEERLLEALLRVGRPSDVLLPTSDNFVSFIGRNRTQLETKFTCCIPSASVTRLLLDKAYESRYLRGLKIPMPKTLQVLPSDPEEIVAELGLPVIMKPRTSLVASKLHIKTCPLYDETALREWLRHYSQHLSEFIGQELIPGGDGTQWGCICVFGNQHRMDSCFTFRKIRTAPRGFGVTCFAKSEWNPDLASIAERVGAALEYVGPADFDLKYDSRDGTYKYLETNPRLSMLNYFGTKCGVNSAYDAYRTLIGQAVDMGIGYQREGVVFLDVFQDLYGGRAGNSMKSLRLPFEALLNFGLRLNRVSYGYFDLVDLVPGLWETGRDCHRVLASVGRKLVHGVRSDPSAKESNSVHAIR
jgi:D-aspartate ligase